MLLAVEKEKLDNNNRLESVDRLKLSRHQYNLPERE